MFVNIYIYIEETDEEMVPIQGGYNKMYKHVV